MSGPSPSTKFQIALAAQALFALVLIFYFSQTLLRHLQFGVPQPMVDYFVQLIAIIVPPAMLLLSLLALRSPRRAIQGSVVAQLLVSLAAARFLVPELLKVARGEDAGWAGRLLIVGSAPMVLVSLTLAAVFCYHLVATRQSRQA
jgi:prolipoprotein diacylglyceryltransferase